MREKKISCGSVPPNGGHIARYPRHTVKALEREAERGVPVPLGELSAAAAGAGDSKHPALGGLELSCSRETTGLR